VSNARHTRALIAKSAWYLRGTIGSLHHRLLRVHDNGVLTKAATTRCISPLTHRKLPHSKHSFKGPAILPQSTTAPSSRRNAAPVVQPQTAQDPSPTSRSPILLHKLLFPPALVTVTIFVIVTKMLSKSPVLDPLRYAIHKRVAIPQTRGVILSSSAGHWHS
jgi:hypothetical protein